MLEIFSVCFGLFQEYAVCFGCFDTGPKHRNKLKKMFFGFAKQTEKQPKQIEFRFVSVGTEIFFYCFEDTLPLTNQAPLGCDHRSGQSAGRRRERRTSFKLKDHQLEARGPAWGLYVVQYSANTGTSIAASIYYLAVIIPIMYPHSNLGRREADLCTVHGNQSIVAESTS